MDAQFVNHSCEPKARYVTIHLDGSYCDVVFVEATVDINARVEVLADYGCCVADANVLLI